MKRLHVHLAVADLDESVRFYSRLFGAAPAVRKHDYAKWTLADPAVNFAVSTGGDAAGVEHLGIEAESDGELDEVYGRMRAAGGPVLEEGRTTCCYAESEKSWVTDPQGVRWEVFHTFGESAVYGTRAPRTGVGDSPCCGPGAEEAR